MFDKPNAMQTLGLELDGSTLKGVQLTLRKGQPALEQIFETQLIHQTENNEHVNPLYMNEEGQQFCEKNQHSLLVTSLDSTQVLIRSLDLKLKKERDIDAVLAFQAEPLLPYPVENAILDRVILANRPEGTQITLFAARKDHVQQHIALWNGFKLEPEVVSCEPAALAFFSKQFNPSTELHFVIHLGRTHTTCALVQEGLLIAAQAAHIGLDHLVHAFDQERLANPQGIPEQLSLLDINAIDRTKTPALFDVLETWRLDITRVLYALVKQNKGQKFPEILFTGEGAVVPSLGVTLCQRFDTAFLELVPTALFPLSISQLQRLTIPIGAALSGLPNAKDQINFRQQEVAYPRPWKRFKQPMALYFILCIALAVAFYFFGTAYQNYQENQLREHYVRFLEAMNKSYPVFEQEYATKHPYEKDSDSGLLKVNELTQSDIAQRLQYLQKEVKSTPDSFPLLPNTPRVSEVLAWLSTHSSAIGKDPQTGALDPLHIDSFSYTMVKRPEPKKPTEKYQVKIELEFSSPTPKLAREFHDALIAPNEMVDPKGEVKWSTNRGKYRTSFFLKDKTQYPSSLKMEG